MSRELDDQFQWPFARRNLKIQSNERIGGSAKWRHLSAMHVPNRDADHFQIRLEHQEGRAFKQDRSDKKLLERLTTDLELPRPL
jgi:hypothetical protein